MELVGSFPFGWIRNLKEDNWQIIWDSKSKVLILKSSSAEKIVEVAKIETWQEAKTYADDIRSDHSLVEDLV